MIMSIEAKQALIKEVERAMCDVLTVGEMSTVIKALTDKLSRYNVERADTEVGQEFNDMLNAFLDAKRIEGRSDKTIERYRYILTKAIQKMNAPIRDITVFHLRGYLMDEKRRGICDNTLEGYRNIFSSFFGWIHKEGLIDSNPCANLNAIKCQKKVRLPYSSVDVEKLKECCATDRDKALISLLLSTGCRISEVCGINRDDIDFVNRECIVLGKGNKERTVFLDDVTCMLLKRYLDSRKDNYEAIFIGKGTDRLHPSGVRRMLNTIAQRASVENVHPHRFRRTFATGMIGRGMPIQEVAAILGHEKLDTTMKYVYLNKDSVRNTYRKYS